jgi:hypothetical protein
MITRLFGRLELLLIPSYRLLKTNPPVLVTLISKQPVTSQRITGTWSGSPATVTQNTRKSHQHCSPYTVVSKLHPRFISQMSCPRATSRFPQMDLTSTRQ